MPGLNVLPSSPSFARFGSPSHSSGSIRPQDSMTVAEIKEKAKDNVQKEARGASALTLLRTARDQSLNARALQEKGDLRNALDAITKAAKLAQMCMESAEFHAEKQHGKHGVLHKEFMDFISHDGKDLTGRSVNLEAKLIETEKATTTTGDTETSRAVIVKPGGSIADRMLSLQNAGMDASPRRRFVNLPNSSDPPDPSRHTRNNSLGFTSTTGHLTSSTPVSPTSDSSLHAFVLPSTLGPPSPASSPSSSPPISHIVLSEFSKTFPSIDELDEMDGLGQPSYNPRTDNSSPHVEVSPFPVLPVDPGPRPSSTPITSTFNFMSRPGSPVLPRSSHSKSSNLTPNKTFVGAPPSSPDKPELPTSNLVQPKALHEYIRQGLNVLFIDVRNREDFDREHIKADAVVCLEPSVLMRENITAPKLEDALTVGPIKERSLFSNRDKFDLVAIYDDSSNSFSGPNQLLSILVSAIYEVAFQKMLKRMPMLIVGGLGAWKMEIGEDGIVRGVVTPVVPESHKSSPVQNHTTGLSSTTLALPSPEPHKLWTPSFGLSQSESTYVDGLHSADSPYFSSRLSRPLPPITPPSYTRNIFDHISSATIPQPMVNGTSPISYPQFPRHKPPASASTSSFTSLGSLGLVSPPPQASINPTLSRRRSDYVDQSQEALSGMNSTRSSVDYPELSSQHILRPPPAAASSTLERQDNRPRLIHQNYSYSSSNALPDKSPRISPEYPVTYWSDVQIGTSGLKNLGNTCYMNAPIQCLNATVPFARYFTDGRWRNAINLMNPLGTKGAIAHAFAILLHDMWHGELPYITPLAFRGTICTYAEPFRGSNQHDSQEFLSFILDGIHEDLNRIVKPPSFTPTPEREAELERMPQQIASEQEWRIWRMRNDSIIVDYFQGQFRNRLECMTCHKTSTTYDPFTSLPLPVPSGRSSKVHLQQCLDAFVKTEVMEKTDAWRCPHCKELRKAIKQFSLSRLPPVLIIHLKRFSFEGRWTDKIDTFVDFPMKALDLTNYMPPPLPPGIDKGPMNGTHAISPDDPRSQLPPYRYDLYGVTNHFGSLSSGHYTAFVSSRGGWLYCDDSSVKPADAREVVNKQAYMLFYKRTKV